MTWSTVWIEIVGTAMGDRESGRGDGFAIALNSAILILRI